MSHFTPQEIAYLQGQRVGRLATVNEKGEPHIAPVGFMYNPALDAIEIGSAKPEFERSKKYRDAERTGKVAFMVDDAVESPPSAGGGGGAGAQIRGIEIRGVAEAHLTGGDELRPGNYPAYLRIRPTRIISYGINSPGYQPDARNVG